MELLFYYRNFPTGTQIRIGVLGVVPVDVKLAVIRVPVDLGNVAIRVARTRFLCLISSNAPAIFLQNCLCLPALCRSYL